MTCDEMLGLGTTAPAGCFSCVRVVFGARFGPAFGDRLADQTAFR